MLVKRGPDEIYRQFWNAQQFQHFVEEIEFSYSFYFLDTESFYGLADHEMFYEHSETRCSQHIAS